MVNLLGTGPTREARLLGVDDALADPTVHLHLYDKRRVFERRKMGHLTALGPDVETALIARPGRQGAPALGRHRHGGWPMTERTSPAAPLVGIVGGSRSDFPTLEAAVAVLDELGVAAELKVVSAHRTPDHLFRYAEEAAGRGIRVIVAGAGGAAHLPGMLAAKTILPVIGVPIPTQHLGGMDSLLSIVQMPRGIPVATVAIGNATNAGLLAAAILALGDPALSERLAAWRARQTEVGPGRPVERELTPAGSLAGRGVHDRWRPKPPMLAQVQREVERGLEDHQDDDRGHRGTGHRDGDRAEDDRDVQHDQAAVRREHLARSAMTRRYSPLPMKLNRYDRPWLMNRATTANRIVQMSGAGVHVRPVRPDAREQRQGQHEHAVDDPEQAVVHDEERDEAGLRHARWQAGR